MPKITIKLLLLASLVTISRALSTILSARSVVSELVKSTDVGTDRAMV